MRKLFLSVIIFSVVVISRSAFPCGTAFSDAATAGASALSTGYTVVGACLASE